MTAPTDWDFSLFTCHSTATIDIQVCLQGPRSVPVSTSNIWVEFTELNLADWSTTSLETAKLLWNSVSPQTNPVVTRINIRTRDGIFFFIMTFKQQFCCQSQTFVKTFVAIVLYANPYTDTGWRVLLRQHTHSDTVFPRVHVLQKNSNSPVGFPSQLLYLSSWLGGHVSAQACKQGRGEKCNCASNFFEVFSFTLFSFSLLFLKQGYIDQSLVRFQSHRVER